MKFSHKAPRHRIQFVTPYGGVWIEMSRPNTAQGSQTVTPYGGVWIEMKNCLKKERVNNVTPYGGVWIEIAIKQDLNQMVTRHALWRRVD